MYNKVTSRAKKKSPLFSVIIFFLFPAYLFSFSTPTTQFANKDFKLGSYYYEHGDYSTAVTYLTKSISEGLSLPKKKKALELLGIIYFINKEKEKSKSTFSKLLEIDPDYSLDPLFVPPEIVLFFNEIKQKKKSVLTTVPYINKKNSTYISNLLVKGAKFLPFGIGYAIEGKTAKAIVFGIVEGFLIATNISLYYYRRCALKPCQSRYYSPDKIGEARTLQTIQLISGYLWISLWGYNIVDTLEGD